MTEPIIITDPLYIQAFNDGYDHGYNDGYAEGGEEASAEIDAMRLKLAKDALDHLITEGHWNEYYHVYRNVLRMIAAHPCQRNGMWEVGAMEMINLARKTLDMAVVNEDA